MSPSSLRGAAMLAAAAYAAGGALDLVRDQPRTFTRPLDYLIEAVFVLGLAATVAALGALSLRQRCLAPRAALLVSATGNALLLVAAGATLILGREALDGVFVLGVLGVGAGYLALAVFDLVGRLDPRRAGLALLLGFVGSMVLSGVLGAVLGSGGDGGVGGGFALAAGWFAFGRLLLPVHSPTVEPAGPAQRERR